MAVVAVALGGGAGRALDRLTHHVNILEMNRDSYHLSQSRTRGAKANA